MSLKGRSSDKSSKTHSRGAVKESNAQTRLNRQIETLFEQKKHDKAWQVFAEMCTQGESCTAKPNVNTYQLLFKHVRKESSPSCYK